MIVVDEEGWLEGRGYNVMYCKIVGGVEASKYLGVNYSLVPLYDGSLRGCPSNIVGHALLTPFDPLGLKNCGS